MTRSDSKVTLLCCSPSSTTAWCTSAQSGARTVKVADLRGVQKIASSGKEQRAAVGRVVFDGAITLSEFLSFLVTLPADTDADVLFVEKETAFLSAVTADGKRVLYGLESEDLDFYYSINALSLTPVRSGAQECVSAGRLKKVQVLVAEDDHTTSERLQAVLLNLGCEPLLARTGLEAIRIANEKRPQVIFLDGLMPEMHGFEVARFIRKIDQAYTPRIVMLTGIYKALSYRNDARLRYGIDGYLTKPVAPEMMASAIFAEQGEWSLSKAPTARVA